MDGNVEEQIAAWRGFVRRRPTIATADVEELEGHLRDRIENNPYIAVIAVFDEISMTGLSDVGTTPWGSQEAMFEGTVSTRIEGEFVSDLVNRQPLVPISAVIVTPEVDYTPMTEIPSQRYDGGWQ